MKHIINSVADIDALEKRWTAKYEPNAEATMEIPQSGPPTIRSVKEVPSIRTFGGQKIDFVVEGLLAAGTVTMIAGEPGSGKTTFVTAMCSAIERGVKFAGLATQRRPVLILDRENPLAIVQERFDRLGITDSENFKVWGGWMPEEAPVPGSAIVLQWVQDVDPKPVIVVDSFIGFFDGNENDASEVRACLNGFRLLANLGATVIFLHHSGKGENTKEYRGSSDFKGSVDVAYVLSNSGDSSRLNRLKLKSAKSRFTVEPESTFHYFGGVFSMDDRPAARTNEEIVQELIIANPGLTKTELEELATSKGVTRAKARNAIDLFNERGKLRLRNAGGRRGHFHYWKPDEDD